MRAASAALAVAAVAAAPAAADTTVGSPLSRRADFSTACLAPAACTLVGNAVVARPGVVVRWRLRAATRGTARLRVLRPGPDGLVGVASGPLERLSRRHAPGRDTVYAFSARLSVEPGDELALDVGRGAAAVLRRRGGSRVTVYAPALAPGVPAPVGRLVAAELLLAADVEPDADGDGFGDETQDNCPSIANDQTSNPCPSTAAPSTPGTGEEGDRAPPRSTGWRRHRARRHPF